MLLSSSYEIEKTLKMSFTYDDGNAYNVKFGVGDMVRVAYNAGSRRDYITGRVSRIEAGNHYKNHPDHICQQNIIDSCDKNHWYIIVDGSEYHDSRTKRIEVMKILGVEVLTRDDSVDNIDSPLGANNITSIRLVGDLLQISQDHQQTWQTVCRVPRCDVIVDPELQPLVDKIAATIPASVNPAERVRMIEAILKNMEEAGQIVIHKHPHHHHHHCCPKPPVTEDPDTPDDPENPDEPTEPDTPDVSETTATVLKELQAAGLICPEPHTKEDTVKEVLETLKQLGVLKDTSTETPVEPPVTDPGTTEDGATEPTE